MRFTTTHEWIDTEQEIATVGITEQAKKELGEIVYIELPALRSKVKQGDEIVVLESTKAAADIYAPVSGEVIEINHDLLANPQKINQGLLEDSWLFKIRLTNIAEIDSLLTQEQYQQL